MKSKRILLIVLLIVVVGIVKFYDVIPSKEKTPDSTQDKNTDSNDPAAVSDSLPIIDFPLLAEARPKDLIDMSLAFPEELQKLDGKKVSLIGFMAPFDSLEDMSKCMMVPSYVGCTFCTPPNLRQVVFITQGEDSPDTVYPFIEEPSFVTGTFKISLPGTTHEGKKQGFVYSIQNAQVSAYTGDAPERATGHGNAGGHNKGQNATILSPEPDEVLISTVADMLGLSPISPIDLLRVSESILAEKINSELELEYPKSIQPLQAQAFSLLGLIPEKIDWLDILASFELGQHVAQVDSNGKQVFVLDSVPFDHPFVRLDVIGAITEAILYQHLEKDKGSSLSVNEDERRALESFVKGIRITIARRYAISKSISPKILPPKEFAPKVKEFANSTLLNRWYTLPSYVGPFFIDFLVGPTGSLSDLESAFRRPPSTMMEFLRPPWYQDMSLWNRNPVPADFADKLTDAPPTLTSVLGIGGLVPWLAQANSSYVARRIAGQWSGDRWALWKLPDGAAGLILETRWQDEDSAHEFRFAIPKHPYQWFFPYEQGSARVRLIRGTSMAALNQFDTILK